MKTQIATIVSFVVAGFAFSQVASARSRVEKADDTLKTFETTDPGIHRLMESSAGYAVFPSVGKGGIGVGGAHGDGVLFENGKPIGECSLTQLTIGLQLGGQVYSEVIFFQDRDSLQSFKAGDFALSAQASAVALSAGASANLGYENGVAVITASKTGLMYEASIGGQKFNFDPFPRK